MIFLRILILLFAGYPLYQDEQERFVCNTIQPGCVNVCYDLFSPVSLFRFWLVQLIALCLPYVTFVVYVLHKVSNNLVVDLNPLGKVKTLPLYKTRQEPSNKVVTEYGWTRCFTGAYILHLMIRTFLEAGFGAAHYYLFGFYIPRRFLCQHPPCTTQVDCYISRPTEKTLVLNFMLGVAALSLFLNVLDFFCTIKYSVMRKSKRKATAEKIDEEQYFPSAGGASGAAHPKRSAAQRDLEVENGKTGSFRKRLGSKGSCLGQDPPCLKRSTSLPCPAGLQGCNTNGNNGYSASQEETLESNGSEVALCPSGPIMGTPRSIRVSKRSHLKPPPPPRRDFGSTPGGSAGPTVDISAICTKKVGQYTRVELSGNAELQNSDDGQEKRAEWV